MNAWGIHQLTSVMLGRRPEHFIDWLGDRGVEIDWPGDRREEIESDE